MENKVHWHYAPPNDEQLQQAISEIRRVSREPKFVEFCEVALPLIRFVLITADLGHGIFDSFRANCGSQFINIGVAEQNLIGVATGDALTGGKPLCYSLANFPTFRCLEQIRNDAAYHEAQVTIVASGGFAYGQLGMSHHATEN